MPDPSPLPPVLHLDDGRLWRGGQHQAALLAEGLARRGVRQWAAVRAGSPLAERLAASGIETIPFPFRGEWDPFGPGRLLALAQRLGAGILHAHTSHAHALAVAARRRAGGGGGPLVLSTRRVDFEIGGNWFSRRKYGEPRQRFIAISSAVRGALVRGGVDPARIDVVPSGVPPLPPGEAVPREQVRARFGLAPEERAIVTAGALTDHKGHRWLVEAAVTVLAAEPRARFIVMGEGELRSELERQIAAAGIGDRFRLAGHIDGARRLMAGFDLYVSSSHLEGLGTAILDAMLAGLPVAACAAGGVVDAIEDGLTGWTAPPKDGPALAAAILKALQASPEERERIASAALERARTRFSAEAMIEGTLGVYERMARGGA